MKRDEVTDYLHSIFADFRFSDSSINGLQVEGSDTISRLAVSVDGSLTTARMAVSENCQMLLVHHGLFWGTPIPVCGAHKQLIDYFLGQDLSLVAWHLPLDAHQTIGNNIALAELISLGNVFPCFEYSGGKIGCCGDNSNADSLKTICDKLITLPGAEQSFKLLDFGPFIPQKIAIVSGAGCDALYQCKEVGADTLITGEPRQFAYHFAKENSMNVIFLGHYASETLGVQRLAQKLEERFSLPWVFLDHPTGI